MVSFGAGGTESNNGRAPRPNVREMMNERNRQFSGVQGGEGSGNSAEPVLKTAPRVTPRNLPRAAFNLAKGSLGMAKEVVKEIDLGKDVFFILCIVISIIADLVTLIPAVGGFLVLPFIAAIYTLYLITGYFKRRIFQKVIFNAAIDFVETFGVGLSAFIFYTLASVVNYGMALYERVEERKQREIEEGAAAQVAQVQAQQQLAFMEQQRQVFLQQQMMVNQQVQVLQQRAAADEYYRRRSKVERMGDGEADDDR